MLKLSGLVDAGFDSPRKAINWVQLLLQAGTPAGLQRHWEVTCKRPASDGEPKRTNEKQTGGTLLPA